MQVALLTMFLLSGDFVSGPQVGDKLPDFKSHAHSGPDKGNEFKILDKTKKGPTLLVFMHAPSEIGITRPGFQFLKPVDKYASENDKLAAHIVWVTGDKDKIEGWLKRAENSLGLKSPVSICLEGGKDGPATYGLNDKVQITVLVCKDDKVVSNFALTDPNANDSRKVVAAIAKVLGNEAPKEEKKEEKKARKDERSPELQTLMRKMIQKDNSEATVKAVAADMKKWAGDDAKKQQELRDYCRLVVRLQYGNEHAQGMLKKLAE
ncbi:MAG: hypothetical protein FJ303_19165 [Planctomycetes bacterium]|nr:hypothetical protein [Planctomycetota bacterium]